MGLNELVQKAAGVLGYEIARKRGYTIDYNPTIYKDGDFTTVNNHDFMIEPEFVRCWNKALETVKDDSHFYHYPWRVYTAMWLADKAFKVPGDYVEFGCHQGFMSMAIITHLLRHQQQVRDHFLFDTFYGIDERFITEEERQQPHYKDLVSIYRDNYSEVKETFKDYSNVHLINGAVPETLDSNDAQSINNIAFAYVDMNNALPELAALKWVWPRMSPGGFVVSDDFGIYGLGIQHKMWCKFARSVDREIFYVSGTGQGVITK